GSFKPEALALFQRELGQHSGSNEGSWAVRLPQSPRKGKEVVIVYKKTTMVLLIAVMGHFCVDLMIGVWPVFKTLVHMDLAVAGLISAVCAFVGEGLQVYFGHLSDKGHCKRLLIGGLAAVVGCAFLAYASHYAIYFCLFLLTCLGSGAFHPVAASLVGNLSATRKGLFLTLFAAGGTLGMAFSQILFTNAFFHLNGHTAVLALPMLCLILLITFTSLPKTASSQKHSLLGSLELLGQKELKLLYFSLVCNQTVLWSFLFFLPDILLEREYDSWIAFGGGHMVAVLGGTCMLVPAGYLADRFSCRIVILISIALSTVLLYALLFFPFLPNSFLLPLLFFLGATLSIVNGVSVAFGNQLVPDHPGKVSALLMGLVWCLSEGIGQGGGGLLTKLFDEDAPARAVAMLGSLQLVSLALAWRLPYLISQPELEKIEQKAVNS
ncbi:MAG: MFS transporter, partial [Parachlamydia sp.]|nr:MFS transporter [Parachlamydia sp.]